MYKITGFGVFLGVGHDSAHRQRALLLQEGKPGARVVNWGANSSAEGGTPGVWGRTKQRPGILCCSKKRKQNDLTIRFKGKHAACCLPLPCAARPAGL